MKKLIVFDFDGVIADSETLANAVLAEIVTELGTPMTPDAAMRTFMGKRSDEVIETLAAVTGRPVADRTVLDIQRRTLQRFREGLRETAGIRGYLAAFGHMDRCIASSSSAARLAACLDMLRLAGAFGTRVYSTSLVARGKPHPDIFLHVARRFGVEPSEAVVIEDSEGGVRAAVAAGMTAIGFLGGSHIQPGHAERLLRAGAHHVARNWREAEDITRGIVG